MAIDMSKEIRRAIDTGEVKFGTEQVLKDLRDENTQLVIVASNAPAPAVRKITAFAKTANVPIEKVEVNNTELGALCGKPFAIAALSVRSEGKSKILEGKST